MQQFMAIQSQSQKLGRPFSTGEIANHQMQVKMTSTEWNLLDSIRGDVPRATFMKRLVAKAAEPQPDLPVIVEDPGLYTVDLHDVGVAPCGPMQEAVDAAQRFRLSQDVAHSLQATNGDWAVMARGESMEGAGIQDGMRVVMSPLAERVDPPRNKIALVQIIVDGEVYKSTIKRWKRRLPNGTVELLDGENELYELPENTEQVIAVATVKGVIGMIG